MSDADEFVRTLAREQKGLSADEFRILLYLARDVLFLSVARDVSTEFLTQDAKLVQKV